MVLREDSQCYSLQNHRSSFRRCICERSLPCGHSASGMRVVPRPPFRGKAERERPGPTFGVTVAANASRSLKAAPSSSGGPQLGRVLPGGACRVRVIPAALHSDRSVPESVRGVLTGLSQRSPAAQYLAKPHQTCARPPDPRAGSDVSITRTPAVPFAAVLWRESRLKRDGGDCKCRFCVFSAWARAGGDRAESSTSAVVTTNRCSGDVVVSSARRDAAVPRGGKKHALDQTVTSYCVLSSIN